MLHSHSLSGIQIINMKNHILGILPPLARGGELLLCRGSSTAPGGLRGAAPARKRFLPQAACEALAEVGDDGGDSLCAGALGSAAALYRRWTNLDRQQRRRTLVARRGPGPQELLIRRIGRRRGARSNHLQPDRHGETHLHRSEASSPTIRSGEFWCTDRDRP